MQWPADLARHAGLPGADDLHIARGTLPVDAWRFVSETCGIADEELASRVADHLRLKVADLSAGEPRERKLKLVPESVAKRFVVTGPAASGALRPQAGQFGGVVGSGSQGYPLRVVIIEDSVVIRQRLLGLLGDVGGIHVVGVATDGHEGLNAVLTLSPDVVILDIRMPGMSGIELMEDLRHREVSPTIIVLTNFPYPAYRKRCQELGAEYFFDKSTEFPAAVEVLQALTLNGARLSARARHGQ